MSEQETGISKQAQSVSPAWIKVEQARHPKRPSPMDFIERIFTDFSEIHGDRAFGDDEAVACGMGRLGGEEVIVIGIRKGGSLKERIKRNFGMPSPEGYRKALRCMRIAEKFSRPVICFIDLIGAYPGPSAEERGQAEAIARNLLEMSRLCVPTISVISGEGGSGGALALAVADRVLILENAVYFVAAPEFCASLTWKNPAQKQLAAEAMRISAPEVPARQFLSLNSTKFHWTVGVKTEENINPDNWILDQALLDRPGTQDYQVDLLENYKSNVAAYDSWQAAFRKHQPKTLIVWGTKDPFFIPSGAEAYLRDIPQAKLVWLDAGHFILDENTSLVAREIKATFAS